MASTSKGLFVDETEAAWLEELQDSEPSDCSSDDGSSGTNELALGEVIALECSDNEDDVQGAAAPSASNATFKWEEMTNYVGQGEQFVGHGGPQNKARNETHCATVFKMYFTDDLMDPIVRETNTYAEQKIQATSNTPFRSRMRNWKPVTRDEMYVVLALFMLMGIIQKPTL
jgi:hypothetical protein